MQDDSSGVRALLGNSQLHLWSDVVSNSSFQVSLSPPPHPLHHRKPFTIVLANGSGLCRISRLATLRMTPCGSSAVSVRHFPARDMVLHQLPLSFLSTFPDDPPFVNTITDYSTPLITFFGFLSASRFGFPSRFCFAAKFRSRFLALRTLPLDLLFPFPTVAPLSPVCLRLRWCPIQRFCSACLGCWPSFYFFQNPPLICLSPHIFLFTSHSMSVEVERTSTNLTVNEKGIRRFSFDGTAVCE